MVKLVITDLDDTLYSWIGFFVPAFYAMVQELSELVGVPEEKLLSEYKAVHQEMGSVEYPYSTLKLPSVKEKYCGLSDEELSKKLDSVFHRFNSTRKKLLRLYPGVEDTLQFFKEYNIPVVAYTESAKENGFYRLQKLGVDKFFKEVYVSDSLYVHADMDLSLPKTHIVHGKKPNAKVLKEICANENISVEEAIYIGDSLSKDMLMAKQAGILSVWCDYSREDSKDLYGRLVAISHWTEEDFRCEEQYKIEWITKKFTPDFTIHNFMECKDIVATLNKS